AMKRLERIAGISSLLLPKSNPEIPNPKNEGLRLRSHGQDVLIYYMYIKTNPAGFEKLSG
ncbi:hypothetical protein, partial [Flavobacterium mesophilum]|uniref:hypothetical protein n=1 Tax=Flavobacterium mesophilum TaxID=3143495 RepID=UPI0031D58C55